MQERRRKSVGYGASVRNSSIEPTKTVAYQELKYLFIDEEDQVIDIVRSDSTRRPKLEELIRTLNPGDIIEMYSIDTLLSCGPEKAKEYYAAIVEKEILMYIHDLSGAVAKISPFSTCDLHRREKRKFPEFKSNNVNAEIIETFSNYVDSTKPKRNSGRLKDEKRLDIGSEFVEIYFAYESYQIDLPTTLSLLSEFCGIESKITFWQMARDFEVAPDYFSALDSQSPEIWDLPKRCGGVPEEYYQILEYIDLHLTDVVSESKRVEMAMEALNMYSGYEVFRRWQLSAEKKPKPRKPVPYDFNISEFRKKYSKGN